MTQSATFRRKVIYFSLIAVLLLPLSYLSQPSGLDVTKHPGGLLDQQRREHHLSESSLGQVDPASETMKLATLGMRGVACVALWQQANEAKLKENWDGFAATLKQISKLQPHFSSVWVFQSWNMSYNVSVEFDDYRYRYHWVKKGIDYLIEGTRYNQRDIKLLWHLGWTFGHKIGRSDEYRQFRDLFRKDEDYHKTLPIDVNNPSVEVRDYEGNIDNWLVSREFFLRGQRMADRFGEKELGQSPLIFHSEPAMKRMNYAEAIEEEGYFGERAGREWRKAGEEWRAYAARQIPTSIDGLTIQLNELESTQARRDELVAQLDELTGNVRAKITEEKLAKLTPQQRAAHEKLPEARSENDHLLADQARQILIVTNDDVAKRAPESVRQEARRLAAQLFDLDERLRLTSSYRSIVNFDYWKTRCEAEQSPEMVEARQLLYDANNLYDKAVLSSYTDPATGEKKLGAKETYEKAWQNWASVFKKHPELLENIEAEDLIEPIANYQEVLGHLEQELTEDFILIDVIHKHDREKKVRVAPAKPNTNDPRRAIPSPPVPPSETAEAEAPAAPSETPAAEPMPEAPQPETTSPETAAPEAPASETPKVETPAADDPRAAPANPPVPQ